MDNDRYRYTGDEVGTDLERTDYEVVARGIDNIVLQPARSTETVEITKEEFRNHREMGTLKPIGA